MRNTIFPLLMFVSSLFCQLAWAVSPTDLPDKVTWSVPPTDYRVTATHTEAEINGKKYIQNVYTLPYACPPDKCGNELIYPTLPEGVPYAIAFNQWIEEIIKSNDLGPEEKGSCIAYYEFTITEYTEHLINLTLQASGTAMCSYSHNYVFHIDDIVKKESINQ